MKIREIFNKIENYNEIANYISYSSDKVAIEFSDGRYSSSQFSNFKEFRKFVKDEYINEVANFILNYDGWEVGQTEPYNLGGNIMDFEVNLVIV